MKTNLLARLGQWRRKAESGFTVTIQAMYYVLMLFVFFALIFDFGGAGYVFSIASNAVRMAAQDAAKNIDEGAFLTEQEVRLKEDSRARAQALVSGLTNGRATITSLTINHQLTRDVIVVRANATASLPILGALCGMESVTIPVEGYAEPAYGISREGQ